MFDKKSLKSVFETTALRIQHGSSFRTPVGFKRIWDGQIEIRSVGSRLYSVCFVAFDSSFPVGGFCLARSFPMSYKAAHRLVCSL